MTPEVLLADESISGRLARLYRMHASGIKLDLGMTRSVLERLGHPENAWPSVHVAGTNGKGSVCAMLESMLRAAGLKTGLYTSPHLVRFNERIRVSGAEITDGALADIIPAVEREARAAAAAPGGRELTFFEFTTALAFEHFRREGVRIAVLETGMGGRLDATNTAAPDVSVITGISVEHTAYLGPDIPSIAREKAGIIKRNTPVVVGPMPPEALGAVRAAADGAGSRLVQAGDMVNVSRLSAGLRGQKIRVHIPDGSLGTLTLPLAGRHQLANCGVALAAMLTLAERRSIQWPPELLKAGLERVEWPGRFQVVSERPVTVLDGAHNPDGAASLAAALRETLPGVPIALVAGVCADKDYARILSCFSGMVRRFYAVPVASERSLAPEVLAQAGRGFGWDSEPATLGDAWARAREWAGANGGAVCVAGSLFLVGEALRRLASDAEKGEALRA